MPLSEHHWRELRFAACLILRAFLSLEVFCTQCGYSRLRILMAWRRMLSGDFSLRVQFFQMQPAQRRARRVRILELTHSCCGVVYESRSGSFDGVVVSHIFYILDGRKSKSRVPLVSRVAHKAPSCAVTSRGSPRTEVSNGAPPLCTCRPVKAR